MTLPATWSTYKLGDLAQYINGKAFKPEDWKTTGLPIIRIQNLTDHSKPFNYCDQHVEPRGRRHQLSHRASLEDGVAAELHGLGRGAVRVHDEVVGVHEMQYPRRVT